MKAPVTIAAGVALVLVACGHTLPAEPAPPSTIPAAPATSVAATQPVPAAPPAKAYSGLGASSITPELIAKFAPPPLDDKIAARIQSMLDLRGTGGTDIRGADAGIVTSDGRRLVFTWTVTGTAQVWRQDGPMQYPIQLTGGEDATRVVGITHDDKWLVVSRDKGGAENPGLYLLDIEGGPLVEIQRKPGAMAILGFISDDDKYVYYSANDAGPESYTFYRWDLASHTRETIFNEPGLWRAVDHQGQRVLLEKALSNTHQEMWELDLSTKKATPLIGQNENEEYAAAYGARPGTLIVQTNKLGDFDRLYRFAGGKLTPITPEIQHDVDAFTIDPTHRRIFYVVNEDGYRRLHALDARTEQPLALPALGDAHDVFGGATTDNGRFTMMVYDSAIEPQTAAVWDWKARKLTRWRAVSSPEIDLSHFARESLETYPARDGTRIPMFVRRPAACATAAKPCPVIVYFHGGPESQSNAGFSAYAQLFVDAGFIFVMPNVRGSAGYGKAWVHSDDGPRRLAVITDIEDVATFIRSTWGKNGVAPKIGVSGGSYGGYATLMAMTYFAGAYDAGVSEVGISNLVTFLMNTAPYRRPARIAEYGDPDIDHDALVKLSPVTYVDRVKAPLLILQGVNDPRVPVNEAIQIHDALEARGVASPLILFPNAGHGAAKRDDRVLSIGHTLAFFEKYLE